MKWEFDDILKMIFGGGFMTAIVALLARKMDWIRFGKTDEANISKVQAETAIDLAVVTAKRISDEVKISDAALQWTINLATQLERANVMIEKKQIENDRLDGIIELMKRDFEKAFEKLKEEFNKRVKQLENELETSRDELIEERKVNWDEIERLKKQIDGTG